MSRDLAPAPHNTEPSSRGASSSPPPVGDLVALLRWRATHEPDRLAYTFLTDDAGPPRCLTYGGLDRQARRLVIRLGDAVGAPLAGSRALLLFPAGLDFVSAFFGCLYAGVIAVPVPPPEPGRFHRCLARLRSVIADADPVLALTSSEMVGHLDELARAAPEVAGLRWSAVDTELVGVEPAPPPEGARDPEELAYLQYTSGSTSLPKGVMVSHRNVLHESGMIKASWGYDRESRAVAWVPNFHDLGLVHGILQPLYSGYPVVILSPLAMVRRPLHWLETISRTRATHSGGPDFSFALAVRKTTPEERRSLDLSRWRLAYNAAEPIRASTLRRFAAAFAPCGVREDLLVPSWGLAEATLVATSRAHGEAPRVLHVDSARLERQGLVVPALPGAPSTRALVGCGRRMPTTVLAIVDPQTRERLPDGRVGEVWLYNDAVAAGYWRRPDVTRSTFHCRIAGEEDGRRFLRTGDLGFLVDGELYITGRMKDLIILHGRNIDACDVEATVDASHPAFRPGCGAAFGLDVDDEERLVVVQEVNGEPPLDEVVDAACAAVSRHHAAQLWALVLVRPAEVPKTSSGKIQRTLSRRRLLAGELDEVARWSLGDLSAGAEPSARELRTAAPTAARRAPEVASWITAWMERELELGAGAVEVHRPFTTYGLDSVRGVELAAALSAWLGREVEETLVWDHPTVSALAAHLTADGGGDPSGDTRPAAEDARLAELLAEIEALPEEEAWRLLQRERSPAAEAGGLAGPEEGW